VNTNKVLSTIIAAITVTAIAYSLAVVGKAYANPPILVNPQTGQYLGNQSANRYDPNSISNPYGRYGSKHSPDSANNPYSQYGNPYSPNSVNNPYAPHPVRPYGK
jgi:cell division protein FtsI/penicillin-binding protein 2